MNILVISGLGKFLNTLFYACPMVHLQAFLLDINLIVDLLVHRLYGSSTSVTLNHFTKWLYQFIFYSEVYECFICFTFLPTPDMVRLFHFSNWSGFVVASHFIFNLRWISSFRNYLDKSLACFTNGLSVFFLQLSKRFFKKNLIYLTSVGGPMNVS